jgi:import inner membrane translocase subunit TIM10
MNFGGVRQQQQQQQIQAAELEMDTMMNIYNSIMYTCHAKCISTKYHDADLNKGEGVCTDRCVAKYMEVGSIYIYIYIYIYIVYIN